jgi:hypothetical protein
MYVLIASRHLAGADAWLKDANRSHGKVMSCLDLQILALPLREAAPEFGDRQQHSTEPKEAVGTNRRLNDLGNVASGASVDLAPSAEVAEAVRQFVSRQFALPQRLPSI